MKKQISENKTPNYGIRRHKIGDKEWQLNPHTNQIELATITKLDYHINHQTKEFYLRGPIWTFLKEDNTC